MDNILRLLFLLLHSNKLSIFLAYRDFDWLGVELVRVKSDFRPSIRIEIK